VGRDTGRPEGFGFVGMGSGEEAQAAVAARSGQGANGRALAANEARPPEGQCGGHREFGGYQNHSRSSGRRGG
jgi:cold-inducible RNA-binding protein